MMTRFHSILWTVVSSLAVVTFAITNEAGHFSPDQFADLSQFQTFPRHLVRNPLSPVQQNQILRDVQQHHRFQLQQSQPQPLPVRGNAGNPLYQHQFTSSAEQNQPIQQFNNAQNNYHRPLQSNQQSQQAFIPQYHHQTQQQQQQHQHLQQNQLLPQQNQQQGQLPYRSNINSPLAIQNQDSSAPEVRINYSPQNNFPQQSIINQALHASAEQTDFHPTSAESAQSDYVPKIGNQQPSKKFVSLQSSNRFFIPDRPDQQVRYVQPQFTSFDNQVPSTGEGKLKPFHLSPTEKPLSVPTASYNTERSQSVGHNNVVLDTQPKIQYVYQSTTSKPTTEEPTQKYYIKQVHKNGVRQQSTKSTSTKRVPEASTFSPIYASPSPTSSSVPVVTIGQRTRATAAAAPTKKAVRTSTEPFDRQKLIEQLINSQQTQTIVRSNDDDDLASIHAQVLKKDNLLKGLQGGTVITSDQLSSLPDIQKLIAGNNASSSLFLGNGQQVKIIQIPDKPKGDKSYTDIKSIIANQQRPSTTTTTTTAKPPKVIFEELTRGVLPPGADFEVIRQKQDGELEEIGKIPQNLQKKVTFVILEEHPDGTVKVQGVRGNENSKAKDEDVDSIIKKIQEGEIKLPPSTKLSHGNSRHISSNSATQESVQTPAYVRHDSAKMHLTPDVRVSGDGSSGSTLKYSPSTTLQSTTPAANIVRQYTPTSVRQQDKQYISTVSPFPNAHARPTFAPASAEDAVVQQHMPSPRPASRPNSPAFLPTPPATLDDDPSIGINSVAASPSTVFLSKPTRITHRFSSSTSTTTPSPPSYSSTTDRSSLPDDDLVEILRKNGLYAMARYLKQSGLDSVLNETGPYTLFVPTDRAFRALQVQLGGPDKAEEKFKENPRLLSGLLLHHVVPGVFTAESLQDEMTGVSLAGTQLRVNTYTTQDIEWNDIKVRTVNGARLMADKQNVELRQGYAHAVDRVLFPLPVGDLLQTLRADRDARFTHFLAALARSGVANMLTGLKTYTVFAPVDSAFKAEDLQRIESEGAAKRFVLRHLTAGTLYSAGMRYYQLRDSMDKSSHLTLYKEAGNVKVNSAHVLTRNIPATNGVIHAIDALL
ncbi:uncharacterized protein LOC111045975 [Nilaparvata lugens]|uniref:uncharacterized protein LOC111045975 n=1 Tax=Nilaparvata lugens TaxID=108931 RepID=UPI00193D8903|nr:uncharacterized protein LOC111045975 [Nilaparvata lugens]